MEAFAAPLATLATALGCGLLVGIERERRQGNGGARRLAGVRTFALTAVAGAATTLTEQVALVAVGALLVAALCAVSHWRDRSRDPGVTTEVALFLIYLVGVLSATQPWLSAAMAVGLAATLAGRDRLHRFATQWLRPQEVRDGLILLAFVLIALPLLPNRPLWGEVLNPRVTGELLALLLALQSLAHLGQRLLAARQALALTSLASGFVSSTATVASLGLAVRQGRGNPRAMAGAALLSCVATLLQWLLVAATVRADWVLPLALPAVAGAALALVWGLWLVRGGTPAPAAPNTPHHPERRGGRMFSLREAAIVAAALTGVQALVHGMGHWWGSAGTLAGTLIAALMELHAAMAAVMAASAPPVPFSLSSPAVQAMMGALVVHALSKCANAWASGGWRYAAHLAPGLLAHTALCLGLMVWAARAQ